ncbi:FadR family transcriptional regulator [Idiomarina loihiensis]|jgi:DNA-binding FadR family transcriptional regulator|uniref:Transcriptional regulator, FadR family n=1 Tax=Idiomarina loihiensis (strain ATCC BAA-735 / DSM 15497 / L2-TR) TaxID=283942 RepID=Q5QW65_IDILO|nr:MULTISPECIES: FadR/GntR family transcriptional regulator [Idiomarina]MAA62857.1 FadR family transcriptional regulator [Idiomarina sp.]NWO01791.1 FadR family transcriptional regulator [Idiomarinaceae bacterium]AAV81149.1 Transcriptional regulator, FadR family [Idiomarina loihiensis L2TR]AGM35174.1 FadR family transcriptional regulator [Idiomarina loihiensis GSL 199]MBL4855907.1 FadR family transcriptional regulator [Idiomarina sp.]|tara:strand:- start:120602 stop:121333 length:732 start_codon:yes stop_codon:yes gene_type:complete
MKSATRSRPQSIHSWVAQELGSRIVGGVYLPGQYIPNENDIGAELGVSRTALREAFKLLTAKGLIESRPKLGTRVRPRKNWNMFDAEVLRWCFSSNPDTKFYMSLYEMREIIEPNAASLAAMHRTDEQLAALTEAYQAMEEAQIGTDAVYKSDLEFHLALLEATNNEFMASLGVTIETALENSFRLSSAIAEEYVDSLPGHKAVFMAIKEQSPVVAREEMQTLLVNARHALEHTLAELHKTPV